MKKFIKFIIVKSKTFFQRPKVFEELTLPQEVNTFAAPEPILPKYNIEGFNNAIQIIENGVCRELSPQEEIPGLTISIKGNNNKIVLEQPYSFHLSIIEVRNHSNLNLFIGKNSMLHNLWLGILDGDGQTVNFGENISIGGAAFATRGVNNKISIGDDCIFSSDICIHLDDGHSIIDTTTNEIINHPPQAFSIGNHCWIGRSVKLLKHSQIPNNTIIGTGSIVTKKFVEEGTILAGNPAKVIRKNVTWDRKNTFLLEKERLETH